MNPIETFLLWFAGCFVGGFVAWLIYDIRSESQQKRIAELEKENVELHFEADRADAVKRDFNEECG